MNHLIAALPAQLPPFKAQDGLGGDAVAHVKFFTPDAGWTWYLTEYNPTTCEGFGLVVGNETELGYFSLIEVGDLRGPLGLPVERDVWFDPTKLRDLKETPAWLKEA